MMSFLINHIQDTPRNFFGKHKTILWSLGVSLYEHESIRYRIYSTFMLITAGIYPFLDARDLFISDYDHTIQTLTFELYFFLAVAKAVVLLANRKKFTRMLDRLEKKPFVADLQRGGETEDRYIREFFIIHNGQTLAYCVTTLSSLFTSIFFTLPKRLRSNNYEDWQFPFGQFTILNVTYSPNYEISAIYQSFSACVLCIWFSIIDIITVGVLCNISYQFKMLQNNLRRITLNCHRDMEQTGFIATLSNAELPSNVTWYFLKRCISQVVNYHQEIIDLAKEMESVLNILLLLVYLSTLSMIGTMVYRASYLDLQDPRMMRSFLEVATVAMQVFLASYWGEEVMLESQAVGRATYEADFPGRDVRLQKALTLIMLRSQTPIKLTTGKFADVCLATFTWMLRASYSAFMILRENK